MKIITVEEHISCAPIDRYLAKYSAKDAPYAAYSHIEGRPYSPDSRLFDTDSQRIDDMDRNGISYQILSYPVKTQLLPRAQCAPIVREANDLSRTRRGVIRAVTAHSRCSHGQTRRRR